jgi:hypothetical protein
LQYFCTRTHASSSAVAMQFSNGFGGMGAIFGAISRCSASSAGRV